MITTHRKFAERTNSTVRIDRAAGVIYDVKLLGSKSRNKRRYTQEAMRNGVGLYEGKKVYLNHPDHEKIGQTDRPFESWIGVLSNPRYERDAIYADVQLRTKSPHYEEVLEAAEKFSHCFGCSHVAAGESTFDGDTEIIESIDAVFSVDLVTEPATVAGLFESVGDTDLTELITALKNILTAEPDNQELQNVCQAFLAEVSSMLAVETAVLELSDAEAGDDDDADDVFRAGPSAENDSVPLVRESKAPDELKRFANSLR